MDTNPDLTDATTTADQDTAGWWPLNCLRSLGRAASIAAGVSTLEHEEFRGFRIATDMRDGAYCARITHQAGHPIRLPTPLRHHVEAPRFPTAQEAIQHARFLIASGILNPLAYS
ncbi:MAG TPA: hypothetical protein VNX61_01365 [Rhizomicrobium sp.]|nr:hypothetical protein [Rhizomicrobium sp.]